MPSARDMLPSTWVPPFKIVSGRVSYGRWNFISGNFKIGRFDVHASDLVRVLTLRASKWAKVRIDKEGFLVELLNAK